MSEEMAERGQTKKPSSTIATEWATAITGVMMMFGAVIGAVTHETSIPVDARELVPYAIMWGVGMLLLRNESK